MSAFAEWLGITCPDLEDGFTRNDRAGAMPVCDVCGALVAYGAQGTHRAWHARQVSCPDPSGRSSGHGVP